MLPFLTVNRFEPEAEAAGTPLESHPELYADQPPVVLSNFVRFAILYKYGGTYTDLDTMFLRDMAVLRAHLGLDCEFVYRWSARTTFANTAVMRMLSGGAAAQLLLEHCVLRRSCRPRQVLQMADCSDIPLCVLPCVFFDPLWPHYDGEDRYPRAPFQRFEHFFRRFGVFRRPSRKTRSYSTFFQGAFTYHWHNCWSAPEHDDSYFGLFNREIDELIRVKLLAGPKAP